MIVVVLLILSLNDHYRLSIYNLLLSYHLSFYNLLLSSPSIIIGKGEGREAKQMLFLKGAPDVLVSWDDNGDDDGYDDDDDDNDDDNYNTIYDNSEK